MSLGNYSKSNNCIIFSISSVGLETESSISVLIFCKDKLHVFWLKSKILCSDNFSSICLK